MEKGKLKSNDKKRERNRVVVFAAEGNNKTEKIYLNNFASKNIKIYCAYGNCTDPNNMYAELRKYCKENEIMTKNGDKMFLFIDSDLSDYKIEQINKIKKKCDEAGIEIILSVPTFEIWFLNHFRFSTKSFKSGEEVVKELKKYISNYSKNDNVYGVLYDKTDKAIEHSTKLEKYHNDNSHDLLSNSCNPYTGVYKAITEIKEAEEINISNSKNARMK